MDNRVGELSILIVTWNGDEFLRPCLESIAEVCGCLPEIVVVDNAASSETRRLVAGFPNCTYVKAVRNIGFAGGNNLGLVHCTRPYVLLLNNDTVVHEDSFTPLMRYLDDHPQVGVVQGTLNLSRCGNKLDSCGTLLTTIGQLSLLHQWESTATTELCARLVFSVKGALFLFRSELIAEIPCGLFHDSFFNNYEETDFCHRVWLMGKEVHFVPTPPVDHLYNATIAKLPRAEVRARELANAMFSLHSLLDTYGRWALLPKFYAYRFLMFLRCVVTLKGRDAKVYLDAVRMTWRRRKEIAAVRREVQAKRVISDRELFKRVMFRPPLSYWWNAAKVWLSGKF